MEHPEIVLAIDAGSTWCKAAFIQPDGTILSTGRSYRRGGPPFGHSAADLQFIWNGIREAVREASSGVDGARPLAISIACRKAPGVWLDKRQQPIDVPGDSVLAAGREAVDECYASDVWDGPGPFAYGYGIDLIGNTRWLRSAHPIEWGRVRYAGTLHSWLLLQLTGEWLTSPAAGPVQPRWPEEAESLAGLPVETYPRVVSESEIIGTLLGTAAESLRLPVGIPVVTGTHDGAAANIGAGAVHAGDACMTLGTNGVLRVVTGDRLPNRFGYTITEGRWALVRDIVALAPHIDAVVKTIDASTGAISPERHAELTLEAALVPIGANGLRIPVSDSIDEATDLALVARRQGHRAAAIYRATLEGIAMAYRGLVLQAVNSGALPRHYVATGGATENELLLHILSAVIGEPIKLPPAEAGLVGVAALAATGAGLHSSVDEAVARMVHHQGMIDAPAADVERYRPVIETSTVPAGSAPGDAVHG